MTAISKTVNKEVYRLTVVTKLVVYNIFAITEDQRLRTSEEDVSLLFITQRKSFTLWDIHFFKKEFMTTIFFFFKYLHVFQRVRHKQGKTSSLNIKVTDIIVIHQIQNIS